MRLKAILLSISFVFIIPSCVMKSTYTKQVEKYKQLKMNFDSLEQQKESLKKQHELKLAEWKKLKKQYDDLSTAVTEMKAKLKGAKGLAGELETKLKASQEELVELRKAREEAEERANTLKKLQDQFRQMIRAGNLDIENRNGRLIIKLKANVLFGAGEVDVMRAGKKALEDVAKVLAKIKGRHFQVAGHTDNDPMLKGSKYKDNWLLSATRAVSVLRILENAGVPGKMLSAAGYSEHQPLRSNATKENKAFNRRIEIQIIPEIPSFLQ
ncbi:OmpA family protein [Myxococcota bacterium]|nr:OmpA family protein [Myxococcota bacterium]MBU1379389.1 OmpA family protein [Myxococcota bacterium]MBU1496791.1 OmpA family protein [Myxococcota bacterium]